MTKVGVYLTAGLGNRLFQVAFIYAYGKKYNKEVGYFSSEFCKHSTIDYNKKLYPFLPKIEIQDYQFFREPPNYCMKYIDFPNVDKDTVFYGYFQCKKYFDEYKKDLQQLFKFPKSPLPTDQTSFFIHIRRGDNVFPPNPVHGLVLTDYYQKALEFVKTKISNFTLFVVSDEIDWCIKNKLFQDIHDKIIYAEDLNELQTISVMKSCWLGGICANSTFSWWGSYLNDHPNKIVMFPSQWFLHPDYQKYPNELYYSGSYVMDLKTFEVKQI
jgi:hypothetical protein